mgnify:CR=1 FL=1
MKICGLDLSYTSPGICIEELDDNLDVISCEGYGFSIPKYAGGNIVEYRGKKDFPDDYARYEFLQDHILKWVQDCEYVFVEDYAINASGLVFDLAEFEGYIKQALYRSGKTLRFYSPTTNKKFYAAYGGADKISMYQAFNAFTGKKPNISNLPVVNKGDGVKPTSDIIDAHALCEMGRQELRLRRKIDKLEDLPSHVQEVFALKQEKSLKKIEKKIAKGTAKKHEKVTLGITETPMIGKNLSDLDRGV